MAKNRGKGAAFERGICKALSLWVSDGKLQDCFWRSAMSGGRATIARTKGLILRAQRGDLTPIRKEGATFAYLFRTECKNYKNLKHHSMLRPPVKGDLKHMNGWWTELRRECEQANDLPFLVARDAGGTWVMLNYEGLELLMPNKNLVVAAYPPHDAYVVAFADLLKYGGLHIPQLRIRETR